jgi:hypothetical protein
MRSNQLLIPCSTSRCFVQIATWLRLLEEFAGIKNPVVSLKPQVTICLPANLCSGPVPNESGSTLVSSSDQEYGHGVDAIFETLAPLEDPVERRGHIMRKCPLDARMNIDEIDWPGTGCGQNAQIVALGKDSKCTAADEERKNVIKKFQGWVRFPANDRSVPTSDQE